MNFLSSLINDPTFWVAVSTVLCLGFIALKAAGPIAGALDARGNAIRTRLSEAAALHEEAKAILAEYKAKSAAAQNEAESILRNAQIRAEKLRTEMEEELRTTMARQEASAKQRIARMELEAIEAIKAAVIKESLELVRTHMQNDAANANDRKTSLHRITKTMQSN